MILSNINQTVHVVTAQIGPTSLHLCIMNKNPAFLVLLQRPCYSPTILRILLPNLLLLLTMHNTEPFKKVVL